MSINAHIQICLITWVLPQFIFLECRLRQETCGSLNSYLFLFFFYPNYALFIQAGRSLKRSSHPASCLRAGLKEASGILFYNNLSVHLSRCGEDTDQTRVGSTPLLRTHSFSCPLLVGRTRRSLGWVRLSLECLPRETILNNIMCHLKVTMSPCFYLNLTVTFTILVIKQIEDCSGKGLK